jgi:hypothetical protein
MLEALIAGERDPDVLAETFLTFPRFVQGALGADSIKDVPVALSRRTAGAARARMPRAAR